VAYSLGRNMRRAAVSLGGALVFALFGAVVVATQSSEARQSQRSRVIDRTIRCSVSPRAGVRELDVVGQAGVREQGNPSRWLALPHVALYGSGPDGVSVGIRAGRPQSPVADSRRLTLWIRDDLCRPAAARVPLAPKGLSGGAASQLYERFECIAPRRILVRVRGEFRTSTSFPRGQTATPMKSGFFAVRSDSGKPLFYAEVFDSGKARLFMPANCVRD
jgi:hypothetical protein